MIVLCDRKVKIQTGQKSQTVNICTKENKHGVYDYRIRIRPPFVSEKFLLSQKLQNLQDLVNYLVEHFDGIIERQPADRKGPCNIAKEDASTAKKRQFSKVFRGHSNS